MYSHVLDTVATETTLSASFTSPPVVAVHVLAGPDKWPSMPLKVGRKTPEYGETFALSSKAILDNSR